MISILAQERLLGAALGSLFTTAVIIHNRKAINDTIVQNDDKTPYLYHKPREPTFVGTISSEFPRMWNRAVDATLGQAVSYLSSRKW